MSHKGFSHIGLSTLDLDRTRYFYENVLKFKTVRCDILRIKEGGQIRHIFFDTGRDQLIAFLEARGVPGVPAQYDAGINHGLGVPNAFYHFKDPNGVQLEYCCFTRDLNANDARMQERAEISIRRLGLTGTPTPVESAKAG